MHWHAFLAWLGHRFWMQIWWSKMVKACELHFAAILLRSSIQKMPSAGHWGNPSFTGMLVRSGVFESLVSSKASLGSNGCWRQLAQTQAIFYTFDHVAFWNSFARQIDVCAKSHQGLFIVATVNLGWYFHVKATQRTVRLASRGKSTMISVQNAFNSLIKFPQQENAIPHLPHKSLEQPWLDGSSLLCLQESCWWEDMFHNIPFFWWAYEIRSLQ